MWRNTNPSNTSDFANATIGEDPISDYAKNSPDEDWAESCKYYVIDRSMFARICPQRFKVVDRVAKEARYNG